MHIAFTLSRTAPHHLSREVDNGETEMVWRWNGQRGGETEMNRGEMGGFTFRLIKGRILLCYNIFPLFRGNIKYGAIFSLYLEGEYFCLWVFSL